ncbi:MAG: biotin--[acetyl-CoA-carboxylase] ligase [Pseudomonadota bacterium]
MTDSLSAQRIAASCRTSARQVAIEVVAETGSTNADLLARLPNLDTPVLRIAEAQTAGRGRAGRVWLSAPGVTLTFSIAWKFNRPLPALVGLPLAVGVAVAETLDLFGEHTQLKWPNDVLKNGNKLAGILIETAAIKHAARDTVWAVIGIGLNLAMPECLATQIGRPVAGVNASQLDRNVLMAALLDGLTEALQQFEATGFDAFMVRWNQLHAYTGQAVAVLDNGRIVHEGKAVGVDATGRLILETGAGQVAVVAGDVSLRVV